VTKLLQEAEEAVVLLQAAGPALPPAEQQQQQQKEQQQQQQRPAFLDGANPTCRFGCMAAGCNKFFRSVQDLGQHIHGVNGPAPSVQHGLLAQALAPERFGMVVCQAGCTRWVSKAGMARHTKGCAGHAPQWMPSNAARRTTHASAAGGGGGQGAGDGGGDDDADPIAAPLISDVT
jgi:hypothetical protein